MRQIIDRVSQHPLIAERPSVKQFIKFGMVGALNTILDYGIYTVLVAFVNVHYLIANVISFSTAVINSFYLNRRWTFRQTGDRWKSEGVKYMIVYACGLGIGEGLLYALVDRFGWNQLVAKAVVVLIVMFWNYLWIRFWVFRQPKTDLPVG